MVGMMEPSLNESHKPKVAILILNWNGGQVTLDCLSSLKAVIYPNLEIIVVDNGSTDGSLESICRLFPETPILAMEKNLGFVEGNNAAIHLAQSNGADYVLLLNNDTVVAPDFLDKLVAVSEAEDAIGVVGPTIYYYDRPDVIWSAGGAINWERGASQMLNLNETDRDLPDSLPYEVDFVSGCAMLVRTSVIQQVGLLDPRFFAYYEETEWCVRIHRAGYRVLHVPGARVWHRILPETREASPLVHYYMTRNRLLFLKLTQAGVRSWISTGYDYGKMLLSWALKPRWRNKRPQQKAMIKALVDYSHSRFGQYT